MTKLEQIKGEIEQLPPDEASELLNWLYDREMEDDQWDKQMKADAAAGRFDKLLKEVEEERKAGKLKEWP